MSVSNIFVLVLDDACKSIHIHDIYILPRRLFCSHIWEMYEGKAFDNLPLNSGAPWGGFSAGSLVRTGVIGRRLILGQSSNLVYCAVPAGHRGPPVI